MKKIISVGIIVLLVILSIDILGLSFTNSTIPSSITTQTAYAESIELNQDEAITKATKLKDVSISPNKFTLAPGKTRQLNLTLTPSNASLFSNTEWKSDNGEIASVDKNGKVTANNEGIVTIRFMTWSNAGQTITASTICFVSTKAPKAAAFTKNDFQLIIDGKKVDFSTTYDQIKKMFPGGKEDKDAGPDMMSYMVKPGESRYSYYFSFSKKGANNRKVLDVSCYFRSNDISVKTPRGIKLGSSSIVDAVSKYGYPSDCLGGLFDPYEIYYRIEIGKDSYTMWMGVEMIFDDNDIILGKRIERIGIFINNPELYP